MAIDILSIPAMSAESERVFSGARRTISWERSSLGATVVEQTECLKSWIREVVKSGGFTTADIALNMEAIEKGLNWAQDNDFGNNKAVDKAADKDLEYK